MGWPIAVLLILLSVFTFYALLERAAEVGGLRDVETED